MQEVLRAILAKQGFLVQFKEGAQLRGMAANARNVGVFFMVRRWGFAISNLLRLSLTP